MSDPSLPTHVGLIVDGNRRWAKMHGLPAYEGHMAGYNALQEVLLELLERGVKYATAYVFSTENWKRNEDEVSRLMKLSMKALRSDIDIFIDKNVRLRVIGSRDGLSQELIKSIEDAEAKTAEMTGGQMVLCFNYGGQTEIVDAIKKIVHSGVIPENITTDLISDNLYAADIPPCDLIVRTSGEQRLSNFMLWRAAYSELLFFEKHWPDMTKEDVSAILEEYSRRTRRYGR